MSFETPDDTSNASDQNSSNDESQNPDPIKNIKSEMNRKLANADEKMQTVMQQNQALSAQLQQVISQLKAPPPAAPGKNLADLMVEDPAAAVAEIEARTEKRVESAIERTVQRETQRSAVLGQLASEYPELTDKSTELHVKASQYHDSFDKNFKNDPMSYEIAVRRAAAELGVAPMKTRKRPTDGDPDTFTMPRSGGGSSSNPPAKNPKLDPATNAFAEIIAQRTGKDPEKFKKSVEKRASQRKNWKRYE